MHLSRISLLNFKNCAETTLDLIPGVNCLLGDNGEGKTTLLDAVHYLSFCKSYFNPVDSQHIRHGEAFFVIQGFFEYRDETIEVYCGQKKGQKKSFKKNKKEYSRLSDHIGLFPLVMISPSDTDLINEGSEVRRKLIDTIISQYDRQYLEKLIEYNRVLLQRNTLLKRFAETQSFNAELLEVWDASLVSLGQTVYEARKAFIDDFIRLFNTYFSVISGGKEQVGIMYRSDLNEGDFAETLRRSQSRDRFSHYTQVGIHKDDLVFTLGGHPIRKTGSQGQQKSFLIALKLAQYEYIARIKQLKPILLLDDIFDKLDDRRVARLMELVTGEGFGQVFITDTSAEKLPALLQKMNVSHRIFEMNEGIACLV